MHPPAPRNPGPEARGASHPLPIEGAILGAALVSGPIPALTAHAHAYTWSLLIFALPLAVLAALEWDHPGRRRALALAVGVLVPMGFVLSLCFADDFFAYPNPDAVLGWTVPALDRTGVDPAEAIPVEEYAFYLLGFLLMLFVYRWAARVLPWPAPAPPRVSPRAVVRLARAPVAMGALAIGAAWWFDEHLGSGGFPGYLAYLLAIPGVFTATLYPLAAPQLHWPALGAVLLVVLVDSVVWEVTLALPHGWWAYRSDAMIGISVQAWSDLPLEAVLVWFLAPVATVVTYEAAALPWGR